MHLKIGLFFEKVRLLNAEMKTQNTFFTRNLMLWAQDYERNMPWKGEKDPYKIWLSEIIMQQTRVAQGTGYYLRFIAAFPTVQDLANASSDTVMKMWEGLGYYSRARNLHFTAKYIAAELDGVFPTEYNNLLKLKGVGAYTAAAIASFAYDLPHAVVDGNVIRVLSRFFGIKTPFDTTVGKKEFQAKADLQIDVKNSALYNQAIMDFGASICAPKKAKCEECPLQDKCVAFQKNEVEILPVKAKKIKMKSRFFLYFIIEKEGEIYVEKRKEKDIWQDLYQFPLLELPKKTAKAKFKALDLSQLIGSADYEITNISQEYVQQLSHQKITAYFVKINTNAPLNSQYTLVEKEKLSNFAFPRIITLFLYDK
ncbi:MAG: A/G-specific adenine glycosylase [Chitinophagales bacterium]